MQKSECLVDIKIIRDFLSQLAKGDALKEKKLREELIYELNYIRMNLLKDMDDRQWDSVNKTVARLKSVFHIVGENNLVDEIDNFPDVNGSIINRVQKDAAIERIVNLISFMIDRISDETQERLFE